MRFCCSCTSSIVIVDVSNLYLIGKTQFKFLRIPLLILMKKLWNVSSPPFSPFFDISTVLPRGPSRCRVWQIPISFPPNSIQRQHKLSKAGTHSHLNFASYFHTRCINEFDKSESVPHIVDHYWLIPFPGVQLYNMRYVGLIFKVSLTNPRSAGNEEKVFWTVIEVMKYLTFVNNDAKNIQARINQNDLKLGNLSKTF